MIQENEKNDEFFQVLKMIVHLHRMNHFYQKIESKIDYNCIVVIKNMLHSIFSTLINDDSDEDDEQKDFLDIITIEISIFYLRL